MIRQLFDLAVEAATLAGLFAIVTVVLPRALTGLAVDYRARQARDLPDLPAYRWASTERPGVGPARPRGPYDQEMAR